MPPPQESHHLAQDIERWIGSPLRRAALVSAIVLLCALGTTVQTAETLALRKREYEWGALYVQQLCLWAPWGLLGGPLFVTARSIFRLRRSWLLAALIQVPLSITVAWIFQLYEDALANVVFLDTWLAPIRPPDRGVEFRFARELLVYWLVLASGAAVYSFLRSQTEERKSAELRLREAELSAEIARARLDTLRSQLHPHFLFNALHSIGGLVREGESKRALQVLASIGSLLRATLDQEAQVVPLEAELALAQRYLEIERVRFGERLSFEVDADDAALSAKVPALFLLTLVENSVRHGIGPSESGGRIVLRARALRDRLRLEVEDSGPGFPPEVLAHGARARDVRGPHIGLDNTRRRLALLYGPDHALTLENLPPPGGGRVVVEIPLSLGHALTAGPISARSTTS
jgi:signal transduction histidine kinase